MISNVDSTPLLGKLAPVNRQSETLWAKATHRVTSGSSDPPAARLIRTRYHPAAAEAEPLEPAGYPLPQEAQRAEQGRRPQVPAAAEAADCHRLRAAELAAPMLRALVNQLAALAERI
jgi:hypothetical protein